MYQVSLLCFAAEYMALPASQYSVLDARQIERVDDTTFRCFVGQLNFFSWSVEPVITVSVDVEPEGCTIKLLSCQLQGSSFVDDINSKFTATMTNVVRWQPGSTDEEKLISSSTALQVSCCANHGISIVDVLEALCQAASCCTQCTGIYYDAAVMITVVHCPNVCCSYLLWVLHGPCVVSM
jgi:hypothetical protein